MKKGNWISSLIILSLFASLVSPISASAAPSQAILHESIYDLLVDRYFNKTGENDFDVNTQDPQAFAGGDFLGVIEKLGHVQELGFTLISIGPVFATETYDGKKVLDYAKLERHFGTDKEFKQLLKKAHDMDLKVMADFPLQNVSAKHVWANDPEKKSWIKVTGNGTVSWDLSNEEAQTAVQTAVVDFVKKYNIDGLRLTETDGIEPSFLNALIEMIKKENKGIYVLSKEESDADYDAKVLGTQEDMYRSMFKNVDLDTSELNDLSKAEPVIHSIDSIESRRFTADSAEENMFPPTRWKVVMASLLSIPGVPMMTYGSEIAVNGEKAPDIHPILDFKTDEELIEYIGDIQSLRNKSAALRTGDIEMLHNQSGFMVYKRSNDEETWIVAINNTSGTQSFDIPREAIGDNKELRGLIEQDMLRQRDDGNYRIVLNREVADFYPVNDEKGLNKAYLAALALVYILFMIFIYFVWKKGRERKLADKK